MGCAPAVLIRWLRLDSATELLRRERGMVAEVAEYGSGADRRAAT
jgi:transcriptional regulator GlxA family with amidase domain